MHEAEIPSSAQRKLYRGSVDSSIPFTVCNHDAWSPLIAKAIQLHVVVIARDFVDFRKERLGLLHDLVRIEARLVSLMVVSVESYKNHSIAQSGDGTGVNVPGPTSGKSSGAMNISLTSQVPSSPFSSGSPSMSA